MKGELEIWLTGLAKDSTPSLDECIAFLGGYFPLLYQFESTEQDAMWHAEGNVAIHTQNVLDELYRLLQCEAGYIRGEKRQALILSALLHDIGKPLVSRSREIDGIERIVSPKHEEVGAGYLAPRLIVLPLSYSVIKTILELVGHHQRAKHLVIRDKGYNEYLRLALNVEVDLLYWLSMADIHGRMSTDLVFNIELLELFRLSCEEYELWRNEDLLSTVLGDTQSIKDCSKQRFISNNGIMQLIDGEIYSIEEAPAKNFTHARAYSELYIMCGISGSGKSHWIDTHLDGFEVISLDGLREEVNGKRESQKNIGQIMRLAKSRLKEALAQKKNVVWDATNIRKDFRKLIIDIGCNYGALITLVVFQIDEKTLRKNNANRRYAVGEDIISHQLSRLEWPINTECHRIITVNNKGVALGKVGSFCGDEDKGYMYV